MLTFVSMAVSTKKYMEKYTMKIRKVSTHSYSITIPKEIMREFKWKERQKLVIIADRKNKKLKIRDWKKK